LITHHWWLQIAHQQSQWRAYRKPPSLFRMVPSLTLYDLPFTPNGCSIRPKIRESPYLSNGLSDTVHVWFRVWFSRSAEQMALFPVISNPTWRQAAILDNFEWPHLSWPDRADHAKHIEDGRPAASKIVVAQNSRQQHSDTATVCVSLSLSSSVCHVPMYYG